MLPRWPAWVLPTAPETTPAFLWPVRAILDLPEDRIDLARAKLTIDRLIDPAIDVDACLRLLDGMAAQITWGWQLANASSVDKVTALRTYLYHPGNWNGHKPVAYDPDDLFGHNVRNKLLPNYLATRKGNCVSMPLLFIILGQKLGIDVTASLAPCHVFVKYRDDMGNRFDLESTANARSTDADALMADFPMTPESIANGVYMQPLSKRETVVAMMEALLHMYAEQGQIQRRIDASKLAVEYFPKDVHAMTHIGSAYYAELKRLFLDKYPIPDDIPMELRSYFVYLGEMSRTWFDRAIALGWRKMDEATKAAFLERAKREHTENAAATC